MKDYLEKYSSNTTLQDSYYMIRHGAAILDGSEFGMMKISGDGAADCLDQAAAKDIKYLNIDTVSECLILDEQASALGLAYICRLDSEFHLRGIQVIPDWEGHEIIVMRIGRSGEYVYSVITDTECMADIAAKIMAYGKNNDIKLGVASEEAVIVSMLETLEPDFRTLPASDYDIFTLGIQWMIQYEKEDYCGHDAMMELFSRERQQE